MPLPKSDLIRPFQVEGPGIRGRLVRLGSTIDEIIRRHDYPEPVALLLAEAAALTCVLAGALKFDGVFTLQTKGDGPVSMVVVNFVSPGEIRGYAQFDAEAVARAARAGTWLGAPVPRLLGAGYLAFTVDQGPDTERYQAIVGLEGATLGECAQHYFRESEQIDSAIRLAAARRGDGTAAGWRAGAIMIQRLPEGDPAMIARGAEYSRDETEDAWRRTVTLLATARDDELLAPDLDGDALLYRLFHEDGVRVFTPVPLRFGCRCAAKRAENVLRSLSDEALKDLAVDGKFVVTCEFCNTVYEFREEQIVGDGAP